MTLKLWLAADQITGLVDGDSVSTWADESGNGYDVTASGSARPTYRTGLIGGKPAVAFDGTDDYLATAGAVSTLWNDDAAFWAVVFRPRGYDTNDATIYNNDAIIADAGGYFGLHLKSAPSLTLYHNDGSSDVAAVTPPAAGTPCVVTGYHTGGSIYVSINGGSYVSAASGNSANRASVLRIGRSYADTYTYMDVAEVRIYDGPETSTFRDAIRADLLSKYGLSTSTLTNVTRDVLTRALRRWYVGPVEHVQVDVPLWLGADLELGERFRVSHNSGPAASGDGWGEQPWSSRLFTCIGIEDRPADMLVALTGRGLRDYLCTLYDSLYSTGTSPAVAEGVARMSAGGDRTFTRASRKWLELSATSDGSLESILEVGADVEPLDRYGCLIETSRTNYVLNSSNRLGVSGTGWTVTSVTDDTTATLFRDGAAPQNFAFDAPTDVLEQTISASLSGWLTLSVYTALRASSLQGIAWSLQRAVDSKWWKASDSTWDASEQTNGQASLVGTWSYPGIKWRRLDWQINQDSTAGNVVLKIKGAADGSQSNVAHVQLEAGRFPSSPILTEGAAVTRAADSLVQSNDSGARKWNNTRGSFRMRFMPSFATAENASATCVLRRVYFDANNWWRILYDGASGQFRFERRAAGTTTYAYRAVTLSRGLWYWIAGRWIGSEGEYGLAQYTNQLWAWADGSTPTKGTDATGAADPTETSPADIDGGASGSEADGRLRDLYITQQVLHENELIRT